MMARTLTITVGYPRPALGPNGRGHWASKARLVAAAREEAARMASPLYLYCPSMQCNIVGACCYSRCYAEKPFFPPGARVRVDATVRLGERRKAMDTLDNFWACLKAAIDGLTDAGVWADDRQAVRGEVAYAAGRVAGEGTVTLTLREA
jgi:hypothetical protein